MDENVLKAWKQIADRVNDELAPSILTVARADLKELVDEIYRLREKVRDA